MEHRKQNIIVIGGGAAGLMVSAELLRHGFNVELVEAAQNLGGRVNTIHGNGFQQPVDTGVEFVHGNLPETMKIIKNASIAYEAMHGKMYQVKDGHWKTQEDLTLGWHEIMIKMNDVKEDCTVQDFLQRYFADEKYGELRQSVIRFAEGFDLANTSDASLLALREEWMGEDDEQYRVKGGFDQLIKHLQKECVELGIQIRTGEIVKKICWRENAVEVYTNSGKKIEADLVVISVPVGVLTSKEDDVAHISFDPAIPSYINAARDIGFGTVIKILIEFDEPFWEEESKHLGFVFGDFTVPTWWTQFPSKYPLLTGWTGGPQTEELQTADDNTILELALESLSKIFEKDIDEMRQRMRAFIVANWGKNIFSRGAYSYSTLKTEAAKKILNTPISNTIFFAGEGLYTGTSPGTVEAALVSGKEAAAAIIQLLGNAHMQQI
jgi:monoamine oxidase